MDKILKAAQSQVRKAMMSPTTLKILSNPRVQKTMMQAINVRADLRQRVTTQVEDFARNHNLVTREDMARMRRALREMESTLSSLRTEVDQANTRADEAEEAARKTQAARTPKKTKSSAPKGRTTAKTTNSKNAPAKKRAAGSKRS